MEPNAMKALQNLTPLNTGSVEVVGSIPSGSTKLRLKNLAITKLKARLRPSWAFFVNADAIACG